MNDIKELRLALGMSQQDLADYLSIPVSTLGMAEQRRRTLPTPALIKFVPKEKGEEVSALFL